MAVNERFTQLPTTGAATMSDIICAVQGFVSEPSSLGTSVQETLGQVFQLFQNNIIAFNAGNPNGLVAGSTYQFCWDTVNLILYICTTTGSATTAVWTKVIQLTAGTGITISQAGNQIVVSSSSPSNVTWSTVTTATEAMVSNNGYIVNGAFTPVILTLPATSSVGDVLYVTGISTGLWQIAQNAGQQITVGMDQTTSGVGGSVSGTNRYDAIQLVCTVSNLSWQVPVAAQGNLTIV